MNVLTMLTDGQLAIELADAEANHNQLMAEHGERIHYPLPNINGRHPEVHRAWRHRNEVRNEIFARSVLGLPA